MNVIRAAASRVLSCAHSSNTLAVGSLNPRYLSSRACTAAKHHLNRVGVRSDLHPFYRARTVAVAAAAASATLTMQNVQDHSSFANLSQAVVTHVDLGVLYLNSPLAHHAIPQWFLTATCLNADLAVKFEEQVVQGSAKVCVCLHLLQKQGKPHKVCSCSSMLT